MAGPESEGLTMAKNAPAFQYYPSDLLSDPEVMFWDMEQIGCYWQMITFLWLNGGKFVFNEENMRRLFRVNKKITAVKLWNKIKNKFVLKDGIVTHKRVLKEMQKQEAARVKRSNAGKKGMESRWGKDNKVNNNVNGLLITKNNSSTSTSTSSSNNSCCSVTGKEQYNGGQRQEKTTTTKNFNSEEFKTEVREYFQTNGLHDPAGFIEYNTKKGWSSKWREYAHAWSGRARIGGTATDDKQCVVCGSAGSKYQPDSRGNKVWLCGGCRAAITGKVQSWGSLPPEELKEIIGAA
jgi:uncharacterized protein YdaU (DUF1376 family)